MRGLYCPDRGHVCINLFSIFLLDSCEYSVCYLEVDNHVAVAFLGYMQALTEIS